MEIRVAFASLVLFSIVVLLATFCVFMAWASQKAAKRVVAYIHHGRTVKVRHDLLGKHRAHCLCYQGCVFFKPGQPNNCPIAEAVFKNCKDHGIVSPVWECPEYATNV